jgi:hypothetical protein
MTNSLGRTDRITLRFLDGKEHTLTLHGLRPLQDTLAICDEIGVKDWSEFNSVFDGKTASLQPTRFMIHAIAISLSFPGQEAWTPERVLGTFADKDEVAKAFSKILELSNLPKASVGKQPAIWPDPHNTERARPKNSNPAGSRWLVGFPVSHCPRVLRSLLSMSQY